MKIYTQYELAFIAIILLMVLSIVFFASHEANTKLEQYQNCIIDGVSIETCAKILE